MPCRPRFYPLRLMPALLPLSAAALLAWPLALSAQALPASLDAVVVFGDAAKPEAVAKPLTVIDAAELSRRQENTLGETLRGLPGVSATGFGANASRPIIRGQDGDRVKILQNSAPLADTSAMSFDHAVGLNPYALDQVEILRGPAALLYGGSAVGGVINLVDRRILRQRIDGQSRSLDLRGNSGNDNRQAAFEIESAASQDVFIHLDGFMQRNGDTRTPRFTDAAHPPVTGQRIRNTAAESAGAGLGFSKINAAGYWGLSLEGYQSDYGVPKEISTTIRLERSRLAFAADQALGDGVLERMRLRAGATDYQHQEREGGAFSSMFKNQAQDARIELMHRPVAGWKGLVGLQWDYSNVNVTSSEESPLQPQTKNPKTGLFVLEEYALQHGAIRLGGRIEQAQSKSANTYSISDTGNAGLSGSVSTSGAGQRKSFVPVSGSIEYVLALSGATKAGVSLSHVERAPSNFELFSMGVHHASGLFEAGNPNLGSERGNHLDLTLAHTQQNHQMKASFFYSRYANYITLIKRDGVEYFHEHDGAIQGVPIYDYSQVAARFYGAELEYKTRFKLGQWQIGPALTYDTVIGRRVSNRAYIARLTPQRLTPSVDLTSGPWLIRGELRLVGKARLGENETVQAGAYAMVNALIEHRQANQAWFIKATNLTNRLALNANTVDEIRLFAPIAGRAIQAGVRYYF